MRRALVGQVVAAGADVDALAHAQPAVVHQALFVQGMPMRRQRGTGLKAQQVRQHAGLLAQHLELHPLAEGLPLAIVGSNRQVRIVGVGHTVQQAAFDLPGGWRRCRAVRVHRSSAFHRFQWFRWHVQPHHGRRHRRTVRPMKALLGLLYGLGGITLGFVLGAGLSLLINHFNPSSSREGAAGYLMIAMGLVGALLGLVAGLVFYARSAPTGQALPQFGHGTLGVVLAVTLVVAGLWAFLQLREAPFLYNGNTQASLLMEFRVKSDKAPIQLKGGWPWLSVEVTTPNTRPEGTPSWDRARIEGEHLIVPAVQGPLMRSGNRLIVARVRSAKGQHDELFAPAMARTPKPQAGWSDWLSPREAFDAQGVKLAEGQALLQMRWRVELYGQ